MRDFEGERDRLLAECLAAGARLYEGDRAKIFSRELSPGCVICAEGTWSCLFVNRVCPKGCFFCPYDQSQPRLLPHTPAIPLLFSNPADYVAALKAFDYRGVGFSGGDPLVTFDRLLDYVKNVRRSLGRDGYLWIYTNGDLLSEEKACHLAEAGIDEIRVDLGARGYDLTPVRTAAQFVKNVVVETPAIPEDLKLWPDLLQKLEALGVKHLNLHQLMQTSHNAAAFTARGYTVVGPESAERPVIDSELAALEILRLSLAAGSALAINYCSHLYKRRYQGRGHRARISGYIARTKSRPSELATVTAAGLLRSFAVSRKAIPPSLLDSPSLDGQTVFVVYESWKGLTVESFSTALEIEKAEITPAMVCYFQRVLSMRIALPDRDDRIKFKKLFIDDMNPRDSPPTNLDPVLQEFAKRFEDLEYLPKGIPSYANVSTTRRLTPGDTGYRRSGPSGRIENRPRGGRSSR